MSGASLFFIAGAVVIIVHSVAICVNWFHGEDPPR